MRLLWMQGHKLAVSESGRLVIFFIFQVILGQLLRDIIRAPSGGVLDHRSLPPMFESRRGHI